LQRWGVGEWARYGGTPAELDNAARCGDHGTLVSRQGRLPLSELPAARACESCEDKGRRFAPFTESLPSQAIRARAASP